MKRRTAFRLAWGACTLAGVLISCTLVLAVMNRLVLEAWTFSFVSATSAVVGALISSRRPANPVGWLFLGGALSFALQGVASEYARYGILTDPGSLPLAATMAGLAGAMELLGPVLSFILVPLYFPDGRLVSPRWRLVPWLVLGLMPFAVLLNVFSPGEAVYESGIQNPLAVEALRPVERVFGPVVLAWYIGLIFVAAASLVVRFRRARGEERQQIKWLTFAASFIPIWFMTNSPVEAVFPALFLVLDALVIGAVPVAAGIAILRYRLYDIDVVINKTLVYGVLTASLVGIYLGGVVVLQRGLVFLTGEGSQLAVVASTLTIAALFTPLRRLIQSFIDRRFYRNKYDAARTLEAFSATLRDETDLDALDAELVGVVRNTVQPVHVSLWLRTPPEERTR